MQSSPPLPYRRDDAPPSPQLSEYSLDLDALTLDTRSELSSPLPTAKLDQVRSEDIDGPSDFTINMGEWMKGTPKKPGTWKSGGLADVKEGHEDPETLAKDTGADDKDAYLPGQPKHQSEPSKSEDAEDATAGSANDNVRTGEDAGGQRQGPKTPPHKVEESSLWNPYRSTPSPSPRKDNGFLQPTVEDYQSELTLARPLSAAQRTPNYRPLSPGRPSSPTLSPVRTPLPKDSQSPVRSLEDQLRELQTQLTEMRIRQGETLQRTQSLQNELHENEEQLTSCRNRLFESEERYEKDIRHSEDQLKQQNLALDRLHKEADESRRAHQATAELAEKQKQELDEIHESEDAELHDLKWQLKQSKEREEALQKQKQELDKIHDREAAELQDLKWQLEQSKEREGALQKNLSEVDQAAKTSEMEKARLRQELEAAKTVLPVTNVQQQDGQLEQSQAHTKAALDARMVVQGELEALRLQLKELVATHEVSTKHLQDDLEQSREAQKQAREQAQSTQDELDLPRSLDNLNATEKPSPTRNTHESAQLREKIEGLSRDLETTRTALFETNAALKAPRRTDELEAKVAALEAQIASEQIERFALKSQLVSVNTELEDLRESNREFDARVSETLKKREEAWKKKERAWNGHVKEMDKQHALMGKALLRQWGREECGNDGAIGDGKKAKGEQRFRYEFKS